MAEVEVRALGPDDVDDMVDLDEQSGYEVYDAYADCVEDEDEENCYLWGVFADDELVGFCVTGGSDDPDLPDAVTEHPLNKYLGTFLSHVYVDPDYRGNGYGARLVHDALLGYWESEGHQQPAFLDLSEYLFDDPDADPIKLAHLLIDFFGKNGFEPIPTMSTTLPTPAWSWIPRTLRTRTQSRAAGCWFSFPSWCLTGPDVPVVMAGCPVLFVACRVWCSARLSRSVTSGGGYGV